MPCRGDRRGLTDAYPGLTFKQLNKNSGVKLNNNNFINGYNHEKTFEFTACGDNIRLQYHLCGGVDGQ